MNHKPSTSAGYWKGAQNAFEYAIVNNESDDDVQSLSLIGSAVLSTTNEHDHVIPEPFRRLILEHPNVVRRAAGVLRILAEMYGRETIAKILYARSGYQVLLDADLWAEPPLDPAELEEVDESIRELIHAVQFPADERPTIVPSGHGWWPESLR